MRDYYDNNKLLKEGKFSLWSRLIRHASGLATTKIKAIKSCAETEKRRDYSCWMLYIALLTKLNHQCVPSGALWNLERDYLTIARDKVRL